MANINIELNPDYPVTGVITNFESYCFATTERHYSRHTNFEYGTTLVVNGKKSIADSFGMGSLKRRKEALSLFNRHLKNYTDNKNLMGNKLSVCLIDLITPLPSDSKEVLEACKQIREDYLTWCALYERVGCLCEHLFQKGQNDRMRYPHLHLIYEKKHRKHDEFQDWFLDNFD